MRMTEIIFNPRSDFGEWVRVIAGLMLSALFMALILKLISGGGIASIIGGSIVVLTCYLMIKVTEAGRGPATERLLTLLSRLEQVGLSVVDVDVVSKGPKEEHLNLEEFISMARRHNQDTVYRSSELAPWGYMKYYHVFNRDKSISWTHSAGWQPR